MEHTLKPVALTVLLGGCAVASNVKSLENGEYLVIVHSNDFASSARIGKQFQLEAQELCGSKAYEFTEHVPPEVKVVKTYDPDGVINLRVVTQRKVLKCR